MHRPYSRSVSLRVFVCGLLVLFVTLSPLSLRATASHPAYANEDAENVDAASTTSCATGFTDVTPSDYFYSSAQYLYCKGAINGYNDNSFHHTILLLAAN